MEHTFFNLFSFYLIVDNIFALKNISIRINITIRRAINLNVGDFEFPINPKLNRKSSWGINIVCKDMSTLKIS